MLGDNGQTVDTALSACKHGNYNSLSAYKVCILDEKSMTKELFWNALYLWKKKTGVRFLIVGCWKQLAPVQDRCQSFDYENASAIHELSGGNMLRLTECRRGAKDVGGRELFKQYNDIPSLQLSKFGEKHCNMSICYYNSTVWPLNDKWMAYYKAKTSRFMLITPSKEMKKLKNCQNIILYDGLPVMACVTKEKLNLYNSEQWIVLKWTPKQVTLCSATKEDVVIKLPTDQLADLTRPAYAITAYKSQGATIRKPYSIYDWHKMTERMRYVAISRGTTIDHVNIIEKRTNEAAESDGEQHDVTTVLNRKAAVIEKPKPTLKQRSDTQIRKEDDEASELGAHV